MTYGEVKSVEDGKITIAVGTMKDMGGNGGAPEKPDENGSGDASADTSDAESTESDSKDAESDKTDSKDGDSTDNGEAPEKPDGDNADGNGGAPGGDQGEAPSMLDLTGDEMTVTVTDDTVITKESSSGCVSGYSSAFYIGISVCCKKRCSYTVKTGVVTACTVGGVSCDIYIIKSNILLLRKQVPRSRLFLWIPGMYPILLYQNHTYWLCHSCLLPGTDLPVLHQDLPDRRPYLCSAL